MKTSVGEWDTHRAPSPDFIITLKLAMKSLATILLLCAAALSLPSCATVSGSSSLPAKETAAAATPAAPTATAKKSPKWLNYENDDSEPDLPGKYEQNDEGALVTLPNGNKYITKNVDSAVQLIMPNGQVFTTESGKSDANPGFVNEDETLVAATRHPATQTGNLYIYIKGSNGKFREVPQAHEKVSKLLDAAYEESGQDIFGMQGISGRTLTIRSSERRQDGTYYYEFKVSVSADGKLSLVK